MVNNKAGLFGFLSVLVVLSLVVYQAFWNSPVGVTLDWGMKVAERVQTIEKKLGLVDKLDKAITPTNNIGASVGDRVLQLPEDGVQWQTVLVYSDKNLSSPADRQLATEFNSTPRLQQLLTQTKVYELYPGHPHYWWVKNQLGNNPSPAVVVLRPGDGSNKACKVYQASGNNIPANGDKLASEIAYNIQNCPWCPKPGPSPTPSPQPTPSPGPVPNPPDLRPAPTPDDGGTTEELGILAYALIGAAGLGGIYAAAKRHG